MKKILFAISLLLVLGSCSKSEKGSSWEAKHAVTAENVVPYYMDPRSEHKYVFGMSQHIDTLGYDDYSLRFYVDTTEMSLVYARDEEFRFAKLEFYYQDTKIAAFDNDDSFTALEVRDNKPVMFKAHKMGEELALVMRGEEYSEDLPDFSIFVIHNQQVSLIYNQENAILETRVEGDKTTYKCLSELGEDETGKEPAYCDIIFEADKITAISLKEKSAKIIYRR